MELILRPARPARIIYKCSFCKRTNVRLDTMEEHEKICYYNPDRVCPNCDGSGYNGDGYYEPRDECQPCKTANEIAIGMQEIDHSQDWNAERAEMAYEPGRVV